MVTNLDPRIEYLVPGEDDPHYQIDLAVAKINPTQVRCWTEDRTSEYPVRVLLEVDTDYTFYYDEDAIPFIELLDPVTAGLYLVIQSALPYGQFSDYIEGDLMNPEILESDLDRLHILGLQSLDDLSKAIRAAYDDPLDPVDFYIPYPEQRANKYLFFDPDGKVTVSRIQGQGMRWGDGTSYEYDELIEDAGVLYKCIVAMSTVGLRPSETPAEWVYYNSRTSEAVSADATITAPIDEHTVYCDTGVNPITLTIEDGTTDNVMMNLVVNGEFPIYIDSTGIQAFASDSVCIVWDGTEWSVKSNAGNRAVLNISSNATIPAGTRNTRIYVDASANTVLVLLDDALEQDDRVSFFVLDDTYEVRVQGAELDLPVYESTEFTWTGNKWILASSSAGSTSILSVNFLIGSFYPFGGLIADIPEGMLPCLGQTLQIVDYPKLFDKWGNRYGGDGITTFALPDMQGIGVRGFGTQVLPSGTKGSGLNIGEIWEDEFETHNHSASSGSQSANHSHTVNGGSHTHLQRVYRAQGDGGYYPVRFGSVFDGPHNSNPATQTGADGGHTHSVGNQNSSHSHSVTVEDSGAGSETHATDLIVQWVVFTGAVYTGPNPHNFPIGTITMFDANTPAQIDGVDVTSGIAGEWIDNETLPGWYACVDGNQSRGCPNLVDRFIMGKVIAGAGAEGGSNSKTIAIANMPSHRHGTNTGGQSASHTHAIGNDTHNHQGGMALYDAWAAYYRYGTVYWGSSNHSDSLSGGARSVHNPYTSSSTHNHTAGNASADHSHAITAEGGGTALDITPANYTAIYIRKCL